jgi:leucyl-tRNA synthetase
MMIFINDVTKMDSIPRALWTDFVKLVSVYAPHIGEELWEKLGHKKTISYEVWPSFNEEYCIDDQCTIVVQVNGKIRDKFEAPMNSDSAYIEKTAGETEGAKKFIDGKQIVKVISVPNKLVNIVVK